MIDMEGSELRLNDGSRVAFEKCLLATGVRSKAPPSDFVDSGAYESVGMLTSAEGQHLPTASTPPSAR